MKIITSDDVVFNYGDNIEKGRYENDQTIDTYRIVKGESNEYCVIDNFKVYEVEMLPENYEPNKYCYTVEQGFYLNPNYEVSQSGTYQDGYDQAVIDLIEEVKRDE